MAVPLGTVALAVAPYFIYRAKRTKRRTRPPEDGGVNMQKETMQGAAAAHTAHGAHGEPHHEVSSDQMPRQEMAVSSYHVSPHEMAWDPTQGKEILEKDGRPVFVEMDTSGNASNRFEPERSSSRK